jgi:hypothetical protein
MLDLRGDDVDTIPGRREADNRQVVALRAPAGKDNLLWAGTRSLATESRARSTAARDSCPFR